MSDEGNALFRLYTITNINHNDPIMEGNESLRYNMVDLYSSKVSGGLSRPTLFSLLPCCLIAYLLLQNLDRTRKFLSKTHHALWYYKFFQSPEHRIKYSAVSAWISSENGGRLDFSLGELGCTDSTDRLLSNRRGNVSLKNCSLNRKGN